MDIGKETNFPKRSLRFDVHIPRKFTIDFANNEKNQQIELKTGTDAAFAITLREYWIKLVPNAVNTNNPTWYLDFKNGFSLVTDSTNNHRGHPIFVEDHQVKTTHVVYDRPIFIAKTNQKFQTFDVELMMSTNPAINTHDEIEQATFVFEMIELATPEHDHGFRNAQARNRDAYGMTQGKAHLHPERIKGYKYVPHILEPYSNVPTNDFTY